MRHSIAILLLLVIVVCVLAIPAGAEAGSLQQGYYDYQGDVGGHSVRLTMYFFNEKEIVGTYIYDKYRQDIKLLGQMEGNQISLSEYIENDVCTGSFTGTVTENGIRGTWNSPNGERHLPFRLTLSGMSVEQYGKRYSLTGAKSDKEVEDFAAKVQRLVRDNQAEQLAKLVYFPISVRIDGQKTTLRTEKEFSKYFNKIFHPEYKKAFLAFYPKNMFCNWRGIMLGEGTQNMWFNYQSPDGKVFKLGIIGINN